MTLREQIKALDAKATAELFHDTYERLAPQFGYETRQETRTFDADTPNGRLMIAVCGEILAALRLAETSSPSASADAANALADRVETSAALPDVAGLVEDAKQLAECLDYPDARRTVFGLIATLTAQAQRIAELEAEHARLREALEWYASEARGAAEAMSPDKPKTQAMTAILTVLALDAGNRASAALKGGRDEA